MASSEREKVGMFLPPPILFGLAAVIGVTAHCYLIGGFTLSRVRTVIGGLIIALGITMIRAAIRCFKRAGTPVRPVSPTTTIVRSGPYRFSRNPIYLGMAGIVLGLSVFLWSAPTLLALLIALAIVHVGAVRPEERYLEALHGDAYRRYKRAVRRWL